MGALSAKIRKIEGHESDAFAHWCPGCDSAHVIWYRRANPKANAPTWKWNGVLHRPTVTPSIRIFVADGTICHYFLTDGQIVFCGDCQHELSGKTVPLPDWPCAPGAYGGIED